MADDLIPSNSVLRAAERVRKARETGQVQAPSVVPEKIPPVATTSGKVRARLNFEPSDSMLKELVGQALTALSRGVRWARGSIVNLIV